MLVDPKLVEFCRQIHLGTKISAAGRVAGVTNPHRLVKRPEIQAFMLTLQREARDEFAFTRREVVRGLKEAIDQALVLEEPMAQIAGWREIGKMLGLYEPDTKRVILSTEEEQKKRQLSLLDERQLLDMAGGDFIDGEFDLLPAPKQDAA